MMKQLLACIFAISCNHVSAGGVKYTNVEYQAGVYTLDFVMVINAELTNVWDIITDYENLDRINTTVIKSEILRRTKNEIKHRLVTDTCILFICYQISQVEDIKEIEHTSIHTHIDPAQSDFYFGTTKWQLQPEEKNQTRVIYHKQIKPVFWIPPIIGPALVKRKLRTEVENSIKQIELLAADE